LPFASLIVEITGVVKVGLVANTAEPDPVSSVNAVARFADVKLPSEVALPTEVTAPVKLAFVVTFPAVKPAAVPVTLVIIPDAGVPRAGVTSVGLVANTAAPVPVSSVKAAARLALEGVARKVATPVPKPLMPVATGKPVAFVSVPEVGVPKIGVTKVGLVAKTNAPVPVSSVTVAAKLAELGVSKNVETFVPKPLTPVEIGKPVALVKTPLDGVPKAGVINVGEVDKTVEPVPVEVVTPVPPLTTGNTPVISAVERLIASQDEFAPSV
jgi:hypothetical protein